jgi:predicted glycoside hydrolase/deacetylase ChbG (UPF0249 family)
MTKLIINADDFGYSQGVNLGIIEAYQNGVVTSATLMTNMPGAAHAAALAKENPDFGVGIHLVLTCGSPVNEHVPSLINEKEQFHMLSEFAQFIQPEDIEKEFTSQFEKFLSFGITPTHIDSHHHVHGHEKVFLIVSLIAKKYNIPIRKVADDLQQSRNSLLPTVQYFNTDFYGDHLTTKYTIDLLDKVLPYETAEIMTHPAYIDEAVLNGSSYALQRVRELSILTDPSVRNAIRDKNIQLITYREISNKFLV